MDQAGEVPGMAEHVEARRKQLRMSPGEFADAAGLTRQALADVRAGRRKRYQDVTINGVARALKWQVDWYDRLLAGQAPKVDSQKPRADEVAELRAEVARLRAIVERLDSDRDGD